MEVQIRTDYKLHEGNELIVQKYFPCLLLGRLLSELS